MSNLVEMRLGDFVVLQRGHDLPADQRKDGTIPVMGSFGITGFHDQARCGGPGVTIGRSGASIGVVSYIDRPYWPLNTCLYVTDFKGNDPLFAYHFLKTLDLSAHNSGSAQPSLNRNFIYPIPIAVPLPHDQERIAALLGALDDKIELNRRTSATLEEMARALFRSWFVDFDPVHAKARGEAPVHMDGATAALFPDGFGEDGLPEGWRPGVLGDVAVAPRVGVDPNSVDPETPYIGLEHMPRRSITLAEWDAAGRVGSQKSAMLAGDFLFGKLRPYFHKVGVAPVDGVCSTEIVVVRAKGDDWSGYVLSVISSDVFVEHTNASSAGTRMPRTNWRDMAAYEVVLPTMNAAKAFETIVGPWRGRIVAASHESRSLATLRDALLPKLMSGELRVRDAERQVAEAV